ncbi:MAG: FkbM family methyltransferase [Pseudomonadota bacterium]
MASLTTFCSEVAPQSALVFDVGAHAGDRVTAFRRNGAEVVALELQQLIAQALRLMFAFDRKVRVIRTALGDGQGTVPMLVNCANPTASTLSDAFVRAADGAPGWQGQVWDRTVETPVTTLDALIEAYGIPDFIKIDTEGYEATVLKGLSAPVPALSFEVTTINRQSGIAAIAECTRLGFIQYRLSLGESHEWHTEWVTADQMAETIRSLPTEANSGDVVACI